MTLKEVALRAFKTFIQAFVAAVPVTAVTFNQSELHLVETGLTIAALAALTSIGTNIGSSGTASAGVQTFDDGGADVAPVEAADPGVTPTGV